MYTARDIGGSLSGDINIDANGDLELADAFESVKSAVDFIVKTDKGGYVPDVRVGADLGAFIGSKLTKENTLAMEGSLRDNIRKFVLDDRDFEAHVIPITQEDVGAFVAVAGQYIDDDGNEISVTPDVISYTFPYYGEQPTPAPE